MTSNVGKQPVILWDKEAVKKDLNEAVEKTLDAVKPIEKAASKTGVIVSGEFAKNSPGAAPFAPVIDISTQTIAPPSLIKALMQQMRV